MKEDAVATLKRIKAKLKNLRIAEERGRRFLSAFAYQGAETLIDIEIANIKKQPRPAAGTTGEEEE